MVESCGMFLIDMDVLLIIHYVNPYLFYIFATQVMNLMKKLFSLFIIVIVLVGCNQSEVIHDTEVVENNAVEPTRIALIEIKGMTCEMGCGSEIRKGLKHSGAVASTQFVDFDKDNEFNLAKVTFDEQDITESQLKKIIEGLNDGQFEVRKIELLPFENENANEPKSDANEKSNVSMFNTTWEFPNLLDLLTSLVM